MSRPERTINRLFLWNASDGVLIRQIAAHAGPVTGVAFNGPATQTAHFRR